MLYSNQRYASRPDDPREWNCHAPPSRSYYRPAWIDVHLPLEEHIYVRARYACSYAFVL
jgi:hypothetical protein